MSYIRFQVSVPGKRPLALERTIQDAAKAAGARDGLGNLAVDYQATPSRRTTAEGTCSVNEAPVITDFVQEKFHAPVRERTEG